MDSRGISCAVWRRSSYSDNNGGQCVELASLPQRVVAVRDSKVPERGHLRFGAEQWNAFARAMLGGQEA
jgi:hypothetical protein